MRIAVIGVGRIGRLHAENLRDLPEVGEVVVSDAVPGVAQAVADELQVSVADDLGSVLRSGVDGCVIASATTAHAEQLETVMRAGVPAFCEKPVARDLAGAVALAGLERETGVPVQVGFQRRFDAGYRRVRDAVVSSIGGAPSPCTARDGLEAQRLAEACDLSRRRGAPVRLEEILDAR